MFWNIFLSTVQAVMDKFKCSAADMLFEPLVCNIVYKYSCHCDSVYVGKRFQQLEERIRQHVPKIILYQTKLQKDLPRFNVNPLKIHLFRIRLLVKICYITKFARKTSILTGF